VPCTASEPMLPPGNSSGLDDEGVGRDRERMTADVDDRGVAELREDLIGEMRQEPIAQQRRAHFAAGAVAQLDPFGFDLRGWGRRSS